MRYSREKLASAAVGGAAGGRAQGTRRRLVDMGMAEDGLGIGREGPAPGGSPGVSWAGNSLSYAKPPPPPSYLR